MRRFYSNLRAMAGLAALAGTTSLGLAQVDATAPVLDTNVETLGENTIIVFDLAGLDASEPVTLGLDLFTVDSGDTVSVQFQQVVTNAATDGDGNGTFGDQAVTGGGGTATGVAVDLGAIPGIGTLLNTVQGLVTSGSAVSAGVRVTASTPSGMTTESVIDTTSGVANEATDEAYAIDNDPSMIQSAFVNAAGDSLLVVFNRPVSLTMAGTGANAPNQTQIADVTGADFEVDSSSAFGAPAALLGSSNAAFAGTTFTAISFDLDPMTANVAVGDFIRTTGMDITDVLGFQTSDDMDGVQVSQLATFQVASAEFRATVDPNGANSAGALAVTFNLPVDPTQLGDASFYDLTVGQSMGLSGMGLTLANPAADPMDSATVLLDVQSTDTDLGVEADGLNDDDNSTGSPPVFTGGDDVDGDGNFNDNLLTYAVDLEGDRVMAANEPQSDFGGDYGDGDDAFDQSVDVTDAIAPALALGITFADNDGDGTQDAVKLVFAEPMDANATNDGVTITANTGVTVHPADMIDAATGVRTEATTAMMFAMGDDEITIDQFVVGSTDLDADGSISTREMNNSYSFVYDPDMFDFDGDGNTGASDTDGEATGTTDDAGLVAIDVDTMDDDFSFADANTNAFSGMISGNATVDCAPPVLLFVNFFEGDNISGGQQLISEQDGNVGFDDDNNVAQLVFTEDVDGTPDEDEFRFGAGAMDFFTAGDFDGFFGADGNIAQFTDNDARGFSAGDTFTVRDGNGLDDAANNLYPGQTAGVTVVDRTGPFVPLQQDINGNAIDSAFLIPDTGGEFASRIDVFFTDPLDAGTVDDADFSVQGVQQSAISTTVTGNRLSIDLPASSVPLTSTVTVTYNGAADMTPIASNNNPIAAANDTFTAQAVPTADVDAEFTAVMDIEGTITLPDGSPAPTGTKIFGFIAVPRINAIRGSMNNVSFVTQETSSLYAFTNFLLGLSEFIYLYDDQGDMFVRDFKGDLSQDSLLGLTVNFNNVANISFTGRGTTTPLGVDSQPTTATLSNGRAEVCWDVLSSSDGTAHSLFNDGFGSTPISSVAVTTDETGAYLLHMTAPVSDFNPRLDTTGNPVIIVVELPSGERFAASGLVNSIANEGLIGFDPLNRTQDQDDSASDRFSFDINLANVGSVDIWGGWNLLSFARQSGASTTNQMPVIPAGNSSDNVVSGINSLPLASPLSQFVYFVDEDENGVWTNADDSSPGQFDSLIIDANCIPHFAFTLTSRGAFVRSAFQGARQGSIDNLIGGYGLGFFNAGVDGVSQPQKLGAFQFGAPIPAGAPFGAGDFPNTNVTLGWALISNVVSNPQTPTEFFNTNSDADFLIIFDRTGHASNESSDAVQISTADAAGDGDTQEVGNQALFVHYED